MRVSSSDDREVARTIGFAVVARTIGFAVVARTIGFCRLRLFPRRRHTGANANRCRSDSRILSNRTRIPVDVMPSVRAISSAE